MRKFSRYFRAWWLMTMNAFQSSFASRGGAIIFIFGKLVRFTFFLALLIIVVQKTKSLEGYNLNQVIFFFLTFNLIDVMAQFLFREVYRFRPLVVSGDFDLVLTKPIHPLTRVLLGGADILDLVTLVPLVGLLFYFSQKLGPVGFPEAALYIGLVFNAFIIAAAFHIAALSLGILTTAVDHTIMIYRDLTSMGKIPVDFYNQFIRALITFVVPVGVMMTVPVKALMGILSPQMIFYSFIVGIISIWLALKFWNFSLTRYSSASS